MNTTYKEVREEVVEHTILSVYGKEIKEEDYPGYKFIDFKPATINEIFINVYDYGTSGFVGPTKGPRIIVEKVRKKRYVFEENVNGQYSLLGAQRYGENKYFYNPVILAPGVKRFTLIEEEF